MSVLRAVTQGNPAGPVQRSDGDGPLCSIPAGLQGEAGSPVPTCPHPGPCPRAAQTNLLPVRFIPHNSKKLSGFSPVLSLPLRTSQVNRFVDLTTKGSSGIEGRSSVWGGGGMAFLGPPGRAWLCACLWAPGGRRFPALSLAAV